MKDTLSEWKPLPRRTNWYKPWSHKKLQEVMLQCLDRAFEEAIKEVFKGDLLPTNFTHHDFL